MEYDLWGLKVEIFLKEDILKPPKAGIIIFL